MNLPSTRPSRIAPIGPEERHPRQQQRRRGADHRRHVGIVRAVGRDRARLDLHLVAIPLGKERPDRPVDQPRGEDFLGGRPPLALDEAAGELARGIGLLAVVDGQREEIEPFAARARPRRRPASSCRRFARPRNRWLAWRDDPSRCSAACRRWSARQACVKSHVLDMDSTCEWRCERPLARRGDGIGEEPGLIGHGALLVRLDSGHSPGARTRTGRSDRPRSRPDDRGTSQEQADTRQDRGHHERVEDRAPGRLEPRNRTATASVPTGRERGAAPGGTRPLPRGRWPKARPSRPAVTCGFPGG